MKRPRRLKNETTEQYYRRVCKIYRNNGYNINEICRELKLTDPEVYNYIRDNDNSNGRFTTMEDYNEMVRLRSLGYTYKQISEMLCISISCIKIRLKNGPAKIHKHESRPLTNKKIDSIIDMVNDKEKTYKDISEIHGVSIHSIRYRLTQAGITKTISRLSQEERDRIIELKKSGLSYRKISSITGRSSSTIYRVLRK